MKPTIMFPIGEDAVFLWRYKDYWWEFSEDEKEKIRKQWKLKMEVNNGRSS